MFGNKYKACFYVFCSLLFWGSNQVFAQIDLALNKVVSASTSLQPAGNAVDGNSGTRWESNHGADPSWISVNLANPMTITSVVIDWEAANAADYQIQGSNDNTNWTSLATKTGLAFGVRTDTLAVQGSYRYVRIYGTKRSAGNVWGYSIFSFKIYGNVVSSSSIASSNKSSSSKSSSAFAVSSSASSKTSASKSSSVINSIASSVASSNTPTSSQSQSYVPLYGANTPVIERIQYTEPDGTLVTRAGYRPTLRHARERGEYWYNGGDFNVAGGPNNLDEGPGKYFEWPELYFQNRTMGLLIRDGAPAGRSTLDIYQVVNSGAWIRTGLNVFRSTDVGTYGWKYGAGVKNINPDHKNDAVDNDPGATGRICYSTSGPLDCYMDFPLTNNWATDKPFKIGDAFEVTTSSFLDYYHQNNDPNNPVIYARIDGLAPRFYSFEQMYVVGKGFVPWYGTEPALNTTPLPDSTLLGGMGSVSYNYSEEPMRVFQQSVNNIGITDLQLFVEGRRLFHTSFVDGKHSEHPDLNPPLLQHANQVGPRFNAERCLGCHALNGRSQATDIGKPTNTFAIFTAADPTYGLSIQQLTSTAGLPDYSVKVQSFQTTTRTLAGGETVTLQKPVYAFNGPVPAQYSVRQAPQVIGMGLLESVDEATILNLADPTDRNADGIRGIPNWSRDPEAGVTRLGRFGWKASKGSVRHQIAGALMLDMGVTSPIFPSRECQRNMTSAQCKSPTQATAGVSETELQKLTQYIELLGVPAQRSLRSGFPAGLRVSSEHDVNPVAIDNGSKLFAQINCTGCHVSQMKTGNNHPFAELRNQTIRPYSDLLLHDMGPGLADNLTEGAAQPSMWRTQPLWGLGSLPYVQETPAEVAGPDLPHGAISNARYLHDGRARTLMEAIAWHDGEARSSRLAFEQLSASNRNDVLAFLNSL